MDSNPKEEWAYTINYWFISNANDTKIRIIRNYSYTYTLIYFGKQIMSTDLSSCRITQETSKMLLGS